MEFSAGISTNFDRTFSFDAVDNYNKFLKENNSFLIDSDMPTDFEKVMEEASKNYPLKDKTNVVGFDNFANSIGTAFNNSLNAVNRAKIEAERMQEDIAMGGSTNVHDAMIAAEKASLSMQMAIQVRNRIIAAYNDITGMAI